MLKNLAKKVIIFLIIIVLIWIITFTINVIRCLNYKKPILSFCSISDKYSETYEYIGYSIYVRKYEEKILKTQLTFFNTKIFETDALSINRKPENTKIEVIKNSINPKSVTIVVTDNNEFSYGWSVNYKIEQKNNDNWKKIKFEEDIWVDIDNIRDENNQIIIEIDWSKQYEQLSSGTYRIVKEIWDESHGYVDIHSNEFEIIK